MAINVKHGVSGGAAAVAAFGGGLGQVRSRAAIGAAQAATEEERRRRALAARGVEPVAAEAEVPQADPRWTAQGTRLPDNQNARWSPQGLSLPDAVSPADEAERRRLGGIQSELALRRADLELGLTTKQRRDLEQLAEAEANDMASPDFTDEEKAELRRRYAAKRGGIQPVERPKQPTPADLFKANTYTDPKTGRVYAIEDGKLNPRAIHEPPEREPTFSDRAQVTKDAMAYATEKNAETGATTVNEAKYADYLRRSGFMPDGSNPGAARGEQINAAPAMPGDAERDLITQDAARGRAQAGLLERTGGDAAGNFQAPYEHAPDVAAHVEVARGQRQIEEFDVGIQEAQQEVLALQHDLNTASVSAQEVAARGGVRTELDTDTTPIAARELADANKRLAALRDQRAVMVQRQLGRRRLLEAAMAQAQESGAASPVASQESQQVAPGVTSRSQPASPAAPPAERGPATAEEVLAAHSSRIPSRGGPGKSERVVLANGHEVQGFVTFMDNGRVEIRHEGGSVSLPRDQVRSVGGAELASPSRLQAPTTPRKKSRGRR